jgi:hydrogenase maturation protease
MEQAARNVVLGLGNLLNRDEGLGVHALKALGTLQSPFSNVELLDGGVLGLNLLMIVEECSHLLILDAVNKHQPPGTVIELKKEEIPLFTGIKLSEHQITFQEVLGLAAIREKLPEHLHLIGIQPDDLSIGVEVSPVVGRAIPEVVTRAERQIAEWGLIL